MSRPTNTTFAPTPLVLLTSLVLTTALLSTACTGCVDTKDPGGLNVEEPLYDVGERDAEDVTEQMDATNGGQNTEDTADGPEEHENWDICDQTESPPADGCGPEYPLGSGDCTSGSVVFTPDDGCRKAESCECIDDGECVAFDTMDECAQICAGVGWCIDEDMPITACPEADCGMPIYACVDFDDRETAERQLKEHFEDVDRVDCEGESFHCEYRHITPRTCPGECCSLGRESKVTTESFHRDMCIFTLKEHFHFLSCTALE